MIYLDVTSAAQSRLNTGVKRIQRGLHRFLLGRDDYQPICWQTVKRNYRRLDQPGRAVLEEESKTRALGLIDSFAPGLARDALRFFHDATLHWPQALRSEDLVLVPDLLWDNRGSFPWQGAAGRKIGVFHDAIALRRPQQSRIDRYFCRHGVRALARFDGVLCISHEAQSDLHHFWREEKLKPAPTRVAPWPVPFTTERPPATPNFSAHRLLYVARLEAHKNHLRLLAACRQLWRDGLRFELELIGCLAYPDTAWKIFRQIRALQQEGLSIRWRAQVSEAELHAAYRASSFTVFPSLIEGFGLPVLESLWHGRPVVCGRNGALGELATGGGCEIVDTMDEASIATGMRRLLTDEARYDALQAEAKARIFRTWADYWNEIAGFCAGDAA